MDGSPTLAAAPGSPSGHSHVFLGVGHEQAERRTWWVIALCGAMMVLEIVGGLLFGSIALVADGLHMSTHAGALLLAALAYRYARRLAHDPRFTFGTGKLGDLAGFTSAVVLAMIALLIAYEAVSRLFAPVPIQFAEAIPIAVLGLAVNIASVWLLSGGGHHHHGHSHGARAWPCRRRARSCRRAPHRGARRYAAAAGVRGRRAPSVPAAPRGWRPPRRRGGHGGNGASGRRAPGLCHAGPRRLAGKRGCDPRAARLHRARAGRQPSLRRRLRGARARPRGARS